MPGTPREHYEYTVNEWTGPFREILDAVGDVRVCYDVGANGGGFSAVILQRWPEAKVVAIEPIAANFESLRENVPGISAIRAAVQYGTRKTRMFWRGGNIGAFFTEEVDAGPDKFFCGEEVETMELEDIAPPADLVKLDVEGAEVNIIESSPSLMRVRNIIVEWHPPQDEFRPFVMKHLPRHEIAVDLGGQYLLKRKEQ